MKRFLLLSVIAVLVSGCASQGYIPNTSSITPYEAIYDVRLTGSGNGRGPQAAKGLLSFRLTETCDGWETLSYVEVDLTFPSGFQMTSERRFTAWERKDGRRYRFEVEGFKNGKQTEKFKGTARLREDGSGRATYKFRDQLTVDLPEGTVLPVQFSQALIRKAEAGEKTFTLPVFNGQSALGPRLISSAIGLPKTETDAFGTAADDIRTASPRPVSLAFFNYYSDSETPTFELQTLFHETGLSEAVSQDFGGFELSFELRDVVPMPPTTCAYENGGLSRRS